MVNKPLLITVVLLCFPSLTLFAQLEIDEENGIIVVSGTWDEIGQQIGSYKPFAQTFENGKRFWGERMEQFHKSIEKLIPPDITAQMKGMAKGISANGQMSYDDAYKAVVGWNLFIDMFNIPKGCSAFAVQTKDDKQYLLHNTDGMKEMSGGTLMIFKPKDGYSFMSYYGVQFVGVPLGANEKGLAIVYNVTKQKAPQMGLPVLMMNRLILAQCATYDEAITKIKDFMAAGNKLGPAAANMVLIDFNQHKMARIEMASDRIEIAEAIEDKAKGIKWVGATNHYDRMQDYNHLMPDVSVTRLNRLNYFFKTTADFTFDKLLGFLTDHADQPTGNSYTLCVHTGKGNPNIMTVSSQIFDGDYNFYWAVGNPCESFNKGGLKVINWLKLAKGEKEKPHIYTVAKEKQTAPDTSK